jgi:hypothetical protein
MKHTELAGPELADERGVAGPAILAIGLIVVGITLWMVNDQQDADGSRVPGIIVSQNV